MSKKLAVENPLAREIVEACNLMGLRTVFEPGKAHPKDWANPGRIRVELKKEGVAVNSRIKNSKLLRPQRGSPRGSGCQYGGVWGMREQWG